MQSNEIEELLNIIVTEMAKNKEELKNKFLKTSVESLECNVLKEFDVKVEFTFSRK